MSTITTHDMMLCDVGPRPGEEPIVQLCHVSKRFGTLRVLTDVCIGFRKGDVTVVLGPSGTGKSVMLKHIVGLISPDSGEVYFDGERIDTMSETQLVKVRTRIGFLFQMGALFDSMTVQENIEFPMIEHTKFSREKREAKVEEVLKLVHLSGVGHKMPSQLSGGQRKRIALARAVVLEPSLVLYDEPTTGLDPIRSDIINELIISLNKTLGVSSIVVTHDMQSAYKIADRVILMQNGGVIFDGTPQAIRQSDNPLVQRFIMGQADESELAAIRASQGQAESAGSPPDGAGPRQAAEPVTDSP